MGSECGPGRNKTRGQGGAGNSPLVKAISDHDSLTEARRAATGSREVEEHLGDIHRLGCSKRWRRRN